MLGYARISIPDQDISGQVERLRKEGAVRVFEDVVCGKTFDRPGLAALLDYARAGDTLTAIRLDRLGRSLRELLKTVDMLKARGINLISLEEDLDTTSAVSELVYNGTSVTRAAQYVGIGRSTAYRVIRETSP